MVHLAFILTLSIGFLGISKAKASVNCSSSGSCTNTIGRCVPDDIDQCFPFSSTVIDYYFSYSHLGEEIKSGNCQTAENSTNIKLHNLTVAYRSIDSNYLSICVSWFAEGAISGQGGYEVRFNLAYSKPLSFCIEDFNQTSMCLNYIYYRSLKYYYKDVKVRVFPQLEDVNEEVFPLSQTLRNDIRGCMDIENNDTGCIARYRKPPNLTAIGRVCQNGSKSLIVSWDHNMGVPVPEAYYLQLLDSKRRFLNINFKVVNTTEVTLSGLDASLTYYVRLEAYRRCSGLGVYYFSRRYLGCGIRNRKKEISRGDAIGCSGGI